jgi:hypothetical protein
MLLRSVTIHGFKSFRKRTELPISDKTCVLIGPNDHGKTNALLAIERLNAETPFARADINDAFKDNPDDAYIGYTLSVGASDLKQLQDSLVGSETYANLQKSNESHPSEAFKEAIGTLGKVFTMTDAFDWLTKLGEKGSLEIVRRPDKALEIGSDSVPEFWKAQMSEATLKLLPKVIFFTPDSLKQLPDTVDVGALQSNEVMQGVFRIAGIWDQRESLLANNDRIHEDVLRDASETLTARIQENWTQGKDLKFWLGYVGNNIRLSVKDTARTITAVGERSSGFTSYFAMRMLLVARTQAARPQGYVFMFDEPGLNLHPKGQVDLQNVFEDIAGSNQIVYSTHSVFLINKNYPDRNHVVYKNQDGSNVIKKPFLGGWAKVKEHLGLYLSSNFLFSDKVLLAEGASDEIYLPLIIQGLIERNRFDGDLNAFAMHTGLTDSETVACAEIYTKEDRNVAVLVDGDESGNVRRGLMEAWAKKRGRKSPVISLADLKPGEPCSIEDFLEPATFKEAVATACKEAIELSVLKPKSPTWETDLKTQLAAKENKSLGKRTEEVLKGLFGEPLGKIWIARKYGELLRVDRTPPGPEIEEYWNDALLQRLAKAIWTALELPDRGDVKKLRFTSAE